MQKQLLLPLTDAPAPRKTRQARRRSSRERPIVAMSGRANPIPGVRLVHPQRVDPTDDLFFVELFGGAGGTWTGITRAVEDDLVLGKIGERIKGLAINHSKNAVATHELNHPEVEHARDDLYKLDPRKALKGRRIFFLSGSPECQGYTRAAGPKRKMRKQSRCTVFCLLKWLSHGKPTHAIFENVEDFLETKEFKVLIQGIESLAKIGLVYRWEARIQNAADYGDPQRRRRLFIQLALGDAPLTWPEQTHCDPRKPVAGLPIWLGADTFLEEGLVGTSMLARTYKDGRPRPHSKKTRVRVAHGIRKLWHPFWHPLADAVEHFTGPVPFETLLEKCPREQWPSFVVRQDTGEVLRVKFTLGQGGGGVARDVAEPSSTIMTDGGVRLGEVFILPDEGYYRGNQPYPPTEALRSITASRGAGSLVQMVAVPEPPFLVPAHGERDGQQPRVHDGRAPMPAITTVAHPRVVSAFITTYNGNGGNRLVTEAAATITGNDRLFLVEIDIRQLKGWKVHVTLRRLTVRELQRGQGFPDSYVFVGGEDEAKKQIGNAVPVNLSRANTRAILGYLAKPTLGAAA